MSDWLPETGAGRQMGRLLVQRRIRLSARLRLRKRINHLQWSGVVTKQLFRLAPSRIGGLRATTSGGHFY
jgi:hypothetical protein